MDFQEDFIRSYRFLEIKSKKEFRKAIECRTDDRLIKQKSLFNYIE